MKRLGLGTNEKGFSIVYFGTFGLVLRADEEPKHETENIYFSGLNRRPVP